jgi:4,5-dihydroxyphthalate decarboxylase
MPDATPYHVSGGRLVLPTTLGKYPNTQALHAGQITSSLVALDMQDVPVIIRAFAAMVREQRYALSEIALATFLQAKAYDKPLVLLPIVIAARFQQQALLCRTDSDIRGPEDLVGRRVGVRAYSQTTGMWLRGILAEEHGVRPEDVRWLTFEDAHVAEYRDPPWAERARPRQELVRMLREGELDAIIVGNDVPDDPAFRTVFDPKTSAEVFWRKHRFVPVNHMLTIHRDLAQARPDVVPELMRMFRDARDAAAKKTPNDREPLVFGRAALDPAIRLALRYTAEQGLLPYGMGVEDVWAGLPDGSSGGIASRRVRHLIQQCAWRFASAGRRSRIRCSARPSKSIPVIP